jgi:hypothetical protein
MALTQTDLEWIRRLGFAPTPEEKATLRVMRRAATSPDEVRLLDSLLAPIGRANALDQERTELEQRLAVLDDRLSDEGQDQANTAVRRGALRIVGHQASAARRNPLQSEQEAAIKAAMADATARRRSMEQERAEIKRRLREIRRDGRSVAETG